MATSPTELKMSGTVYFLPDGADEQIELGYAEIPVRISFEAKPGYTGIRGTQDSGPYAPGSK